MTTRTLASAETDLAAAADKLELARRGVGARFLQAYYSTFATIQRFPQLYSLVADGVPGLEIRNAILERYGHRVVYPVRPYEVVILAVAHTSRRPEHWHRRLDDPTLT